MKPWILSSTLGFSIQLYYICVFAIVQLHVYPILVAISTLSLVTVHLDPQFYG
jgi:hypothetical protein